MSFIIGAERELYMASADFMKVIRIPFPLSTSVIKRRTPYGGNLGKRQYIIGGHTSNIMIDEQYRCYKQSIPRPLAAPNVTAGAGTTLQILYTRFYDEVTAERSPLSEGTSITAGLNRAWANLPTIVPGDSLLVEGVCTIAAGVVTGTRANFDELRPGDRIAITGALTRWARIRTIATSNSMTIDDIVMAGVGVTLQAKIVPRVSHVELWAAVNGALPRFILRTRLGTTTVTESTAILALGEAETETFEEMPYGAMSVLYNQRQIITGVPGREDSAFLSLIGFPERYGGLQFKTDFNEPIVGVEVHRTYVVLICPESSYILQGVADEDYVLDGMEADIGGFGPIGRANGVLYIPGITGMQAYNGAAHPVLHNRKSEWAAAHIARQAAMEAGFFAVNPHDETIQYYPNTAYEPGPNPTSGVWVAHYSGVAATGTGEIAPPQWLNDAQTINDGSVTAARYMIAVGARSGRFYRGTAEGALYAENEDGTVALDVDSRLVLRHELHFDAGGGLDEAIALDAVWSYVRAEESDWTLKIWAGDEFAYPNGPDDGAGHIPVAAEFIDEVDASAEVDAVSGYLLSDKTVHVHPKVELDGRGHTLEYIFENPLNVVFMGMGGHRKAVGVATRPPKWQDPV